MKRAASSDFLGKEPLFPLLMRLSVPAVVGMMVMAMYNIVDSIFVGRGAGSLALAGLAIAFPVQISLGALGQMVGVGSASIASRKLGEGKQDEAEAALGACVAFVLILGVLVTGLLAMTLESTLTLFGATDAILPYAKDYVQVLLWAVPLQMAAMSTMNLIRAEGNAKKAMNVMLTGIVLNIILDPIFIFVLDMGIKGAAWATVIGQAVNFVLVFLYYLRGNSVLKLKRENLKLRFKLIREIVVLGLPNFVQMAGTGLIATIINNLLGSFSGEVAISTYGIISRLMSFLMMPLGGIAQGFQPIAGFNYGAKNYLRVRQVFMLALGLGAGISLLFFSLVMTFPGALIGLFTTDPELQAYAIPALKMFCMATPIIGFQMISSIYFQAIGQARPAMLLGLSRQFIVLLPMIFLLSHFYQAQGIWVAFPASDLISVLVTGLVLSFELRKLNKKIGEASGSGIEPQASGV
ncbi:MATE family efflux transporter [Reinekea marinisedimentorum]|uniref:Multidrug export protein MepA n=1 Tax=Reinekea marinisedimentorum TaxID=230495 RepID=A0A4R3I343_9GAMM|nr:MATE family efflux transporter [Reinekea marinisedimentorum]TCS40209.1 putative MATE family efflux protein [Reinekea marinisedimentorum]